MNLQRSPIQPLTIGQYVFSAGSRTPTSLNAAFINGVSGPAIGIRYMAQTTDTIDEFYIFMDAFTGTLGNITMEAQIFNESATLSRAGATSRDTSTATVMAAGNDQWIKFTFGTPYTPAIGEILWMVAYNTSVVQATDFPQILTACNISGLIELPFLMTGYHTTNGYTTSPAQSVRTPFMIKQGANYFGNPFTQINATYYTNNQRERGIQFTTTEDVNVCAYLNGSSSASFVLARLLADATAPGGGAINSYNLDTDANQTTNDICQGKFFATITLTGGVTYKWTVTYSANNQTPIVMQIEDYATYSTMFDTFRADNTLALPWGIIDNGAGGWATPDKAICPALALLIADFPAQVTNPFGGSSGV